MTAAEWLVVVLVALAIWLGVGFVLALFLRDRITIRRD